MPSVLAELRKHARRFGLSKRGAATFVAAMESRDPDNLEDLEEVLIDMRTPKSTIRLVLDIWSRSRGL